MPRLPSVTPYVVLFASVSVLGSCLVDRQGGKASTSATTAAGANGSGGSLSAGTGGAASVGGMTAGTGGAMNPPPGAVLNVAIAIENENDPDNFQTSVTWDDVTDSDLADYLVVRSRAVLDPAIDKPVDGTVYTAGDVIGAGEVVGQATIALIKDDKPAVGVANRYYVWARDQAGQYGDVGTGRRLVPIPPQRGRLHLDGFNNSNTPTIATVVEQPRDMTVTATAKAGEFRTTSIELQSQVDRGLFAPKIVFGNEPFYIEGNGLAFENGGDVAVAHFGVARLQAGDTRSLEVEFHPSNPDVFVDFEVRYNRVLVAPSSDSEDGGNATGELMMVDISRTRQRNSGQAFNEAFGRRPDAGAYRTALVSDGGGFLYATSANDAVIRRFNTRNLSAAPQTLDLRENEQSQALGLAWLPGPLLHTVVTKGYVRDGPPPTSVDIDLVAVAATATPMIESARWSLATNVTAVNSNVTHAGLAAFGDEHVVVPVPNAGRILIFDFATQTTRNIDVSGDCELPRHAALNPAGTEASVTCIHVGNNQSLLKRIDVVNGTVSFTSGFIDSNSPQSIRYLNATDILVSYSKNQRRVVRFDANNNTSQHYCEPRWVGPDGMGGFLVANTYEVRRLDDQLNNDWAVSIPFGKNHAFALTPF